MLQSPSMGLRLDGTAVATGFFCCSEKPTRSEKVNPVTGGSLGGPDKLILRAGMFPSFLVVGVGGILFDVDVEVGTVVFANVVLSGLKGDAWPNDGNCVKRSAIGGTSNIDESSIRSQGKGAENSRGGMETGLVGSTTDEAGAGIPFVVAIREGSWKGRTDVRGVSPLRPESAILLGKMVLRRLIRRTRRKQAWLL